MNTLFSQDNFKVKDLRNHIEILRSIEDINEIKHEVDWNLEAAAYTRYSTENNLPAPLFSNIKGVESGFRILGAPAALSSNSDMPFARVALSIGLSTMSTGKEIVDNLISTTYEKPVAPRVLDSIDAKVKENILTGDLADLTKFPVPFVHKDDGNRYTNTYGIIIAQTPDGKWTNWSIARIMMIDGKNMTGLVMHPQHIAQIWQKWELGFSRQF